MVTNLKNLIVLLVVTVLGCPLASAVTVYHVDTIHGSDSYDGLTKETAFQTIQAGINAAANGDEVRVWPGVYTELINFFGKTITVQSAADAAVLQAPGDFAVSCYFAEGPGSVLKNFVICGSDMAVFLAGSSPTLKNLTIVDNEFGISAYAGAAPTITNCIFWNNTDGDLYQCQARYSRLEGGGPALNNIDANPQFADPDNGDYHLKSVVGRFNPLPPAEQGWTEPVLLSELEDPVYGYVPQFPFLSQDKLTIYMRRGFHGLISAHIVAAHRNMPEGPFTEEWLVYSSPTGLAVGCPWFSADELRMYYRCKIGDNEYILKQAERATKSDPMVETITFSAIHINGGFDSKPSLMEDELTIYWESIRSGAYGTGAIWMATRNSIHEQFTNPVNVSELNTNFAEGNSNGPCVLPDGLTIYFGSKRDGKLYGDIYKATRNNQNEPFGNIQKIGASNPTIADYWPYATPDEKEIYFQRDSGIWFSQFNEGQWVVDDVTSPCIDAGDPTEDPAGEPMTNGGRINMGAYGGTAYASMSDVSVMVYHVDTIRGSDSNDGLTQMTAFQTIQAGINAAEDGDEVHVWPGVYTELINFQGKAITVQSAADAAVLQAPGDYAISCNSAEGPDSILKNFVIRGSDKAVFLAGSSPTLKNLTIVDNECGISACSGVAPAITNCIFWNNTDGDLYQCQASFSCLKNGDSANNNFDAYPQFADPTNGDYHLKSVRGRFVPLPPAEQGWSEPVFRSDLNDPIIGVRTCLSRDMLTIYFSRTVPEGGHRIVEASRSIPKGSFTSFKVANELYFGTDTHNPWVTSDELRLYYVEDTTFKMAERTSKNDVWVVKYSFPELHMDGYVDTRPSLTEDELIIFWDSTRPGAYGAIAIWMATRNSTDESFSNPVNVRELNTNFAEGNSNAPCIMPDGLTIYFSGRRDGITNGDVFKATRSSLNEPFVDIQKIGMSDPVLSDYRPYVTPDESSIYYLKCDSGQTTYGLFFSQFNEGQWIMDDVTSPCIDAGDWMEDPAGERMPNGGRVNMGAYGGTGYASMSEWPVNGDVNRDGVVDLIDFAILSQNWLASLPWVQQ